MWSFERGKQFLKRWKQTPRAAVVREHTTFPAKRPHNRALSVPCSWAQGPEGTGQCSERPTTHGSNARNWGGPRTLFPPQVCSTCPASQLRPGVAILLKNPPGKRPTNQAPTVFLEQRPVLQRLFQIPFSKEVLKPPAVSPTLGSLRGSSEQSVGDASGSASAREDRDTTYFQCDAITGPLNTQALCITAAFEVGSAEQFLIIFSPLVSYLQIYTAQFSRDPEGGVSSLR